MASLSNINGLFDVHSTGAILFSTSHGTSGQILRSNGNAAPTWVAASTVIGGPYLPLTGGTLSGATATATGINFTVGGNLFGTNATFSGNQVTVDPASGDAILQLQSSTQTLRIDQNSIRTGTNNNLALFTNGNSNQLVLKQSNGFVGIGTITPGSDLTIKENGVIGFQYTTGAGSYHTITGGGVNPMSFTVNPFSALDPVFSFNSAAGNIMTMKNGGNVGIGINLPAAKLHVQASNAQMLIGYNGNSQNFFDADNHYFRNSAFVNILQLGSDTILGTPNNTQRLKITTDYSQIGPMIIKYPYYRMDSFKSDGSGYFWAFGHEKSDGTQSIGMMLNDGVSGNKYTRIINTLQIASFTANEYNGAYPSFATNIVLRNSGNSYLNGGNVGIGTTSPDYDLDVERTATAINDDPTIRVRNAWSGEGNNTGFSNRADGLYTAGSTAVTTRIRSRYDTGANYGEVGTTTNHDFRFITNGGEKMRIDNGGNVRVGTASTPDTLFQIYATTSEDPAAPGTTTTGKFCINTSQQATLSIGKNSGNVYWISNVNKSFANSFYHIALNPLGGRVGIGTIAPTQPLDVNGYSICDKQFQRDNSTTIILGTPRILNIGYRGSSGTYDFNPVTLFGNLAQGGQCEIQVTGWQNKVNNGFIYWRDNGSNTNIGNGIVGFVQTAVVGSGVISVSTNAGGNVITITFTGWHANAHGWNARIISNNT